MSKKRETFEGIMGGRFYDLVARITGYGSSYYRRAAMAIPVQPGMSLLELGCGTASLSLAMADRMQGRGRIVGMDISASQIDWARKKTRSSPVPIELRHGSVLSLPFDQGSINGICMSQVLHSMTEQEQKKCLKESHRVLVPGGFFALVEWSKPRFGYTAAVWTSSLLGARDSHNWRGTYPMLFSTFGFLLSTDVYIDSLNRCQVFIKDR